MDKFPATQAKRVFNALIRIGWNIKRQHGGSHRILFKYGYPDYTFAYHDSKELSPITVKRIAKRTGLKPEDLS